MTVLPALREGKLQQKNPSSNVGFNKKNYHLNF